MSSLIARRCPHCGYLNTLDLAELERRDRIIYRNDDQEVRATCFNCNKDFMIVVLAEDKHER